jgi:8-oxo-dGTP pyrophosphatase MutT (NUDIX family)
VTAIRVGVVDVYVIRVIRNAWRVLVLRRGERGRSTGSWETVHGRIERGETPERAARRELHEETGLDADRLYSITVNPFYLHATNTVQLAVAFAAFVASDEVRLGPEHDAHEWLTANQAVKRFARPREGEALGHIRKLLRSGHAGAVEDVLRVR